MNDATGSTLQYPDRNAISEALAILKVSRATLYKRIAAGLLKITKDGRRSFVTGAEIARYLAACEAES